MESNKLPDILTQLEPYTNLLLLDNSYKEAILLVNPCTDIFLLEGLLKSYKYSFKRIKHKIYLYVEVDNKVTLQL